MRMSVVQTPARFYPYIGGVEQVAFYLSRELIKLGYRVKVICADEPRTGSGLIENIEVERLAYAAKIANSNITLTLPGCLLREDFDILHTHLPHPWTADISAIAASIKKRPLFLTYHNDVTGEGLNRYIARFYNLTALRFLLRKACRIFITREEYIKKSSFLGGFTDKIVVTPPGVDLGKFKPAPADRKDGKAIFFLSRLDEFHRYKGLDYLLLSLKGLGSDMPLKLYIGGSGELLGHYKRMACENNLGSSVVFLGKLSEEELIKYYNLCDVFVLPSISSVYEGFGLVALEAMACGKPVVVTDIVGVAGDVKAYNAGLVVSPKNTEELAEALRHLLCDDNDRSQKGQRAYNLVKDKYTWSRHAAIVEQEYRKAAG